MEDDLTTVDSFVDVARGSSFIDGKFTAYRVNTCMRKEKSINNDLSYYLLGEAYQIFAFLKVEQRRVQSNPIFYQW